MEYPIITLPMKNCCYSLLAAACVAMPVSAQTLANYQSTVTSQGPSNYFRLDGGLTSSVNPSIALTKLGPSGGFTYDAFGNSTNSHFFVGTTDELSNETDPLISTSGTTNGAINAKGSISFLFRSLSGLNFGGQRWLFDGRKLQVPTATAGTAFHNALALFFENETSTNSPNSLKLEFGDTTQPILNSNNIAFNTWYYFALTWDEARVPNKAIWYLGVPGQPLMTGTTTNAADAVAGEANGLFIGNRATTGGAFRSPGNGRIDEFAIWGRELSSLEISNQFAQLPPSTAGGLRVTNIVVNDSFADGNRTNTGPLQADWWSSSSTNGNSVEAYPNQLGLVSGTSGRGLHGTFAPQNLAIGDTIRATYTFTTPPTVTQSGSGGAVFKIGLMEFNNPGLAADLLSESASVNPLYTNLPGYMADYDVTKPALAGNDVGFRRHNAPNTTGRFLGTTTGWTSLSTGPDANYEFFPNTTYVGVMSITRTDFDSVDLFSSVSSNGVVMASHLEGNSGQIPNNFGMLGFWVNSLVFGSTNVAGQTVDNGLTFSNIRVEVIAAAPPNLRILPVGTNVVLSWPTAGATGYNLESTPSLSTPAWTGAGDPTVVGNDNFVTNAVSGGEKYYRLKK
jgi:hypothetical protein